jgi:hypothetical protein
MRIPPPLPQKYIVRETTFTIVCALIVQLGEENV